MWLCNDLVLFACTFKCSVLANTFSNSNFLWSCRIFINMILLFTCQLFDGHNGSGAAIYTKEKLLDNILGAIPSDLNRDEWLAALPRALVAGFVKTDKHFQNIGTNALLHANNLVCRNMIWVLTFFSCMKIVFFIYPETYEIFSSHPETNSFADTYFSLTLISMLLADTAFVINNHGIQLCSSHSQIWLFIIHDLSSLCYFT